MFATQEGHVLRHRRGRRRVLLPVLADRAGGERDVERGAPVVVRRHVVEGRHDHVGSLLASVTGCVHSISQNEL